VGCPENVTLTYDHCKNYPELVTASVQTLWDYTSQLANASRIDSLDNLRDARIYLYRGTKVSI
jgi:hypothetical protein